MQEFARGQALSHGQGQPIVQQIQQSFGLNAQRMNPPVFHDPQGNQPQSLMPSNFPNVPMNTQQQMKASFNMNPMMHGLNNPGVSRQLKMLNQQEIARLQQTGLGAQHSSNQQPAVDMFVSPSMQSSQDQMRGSPHPAAQTVGPSGSNQGMVPGNPQQNVQKRMMTPVEFQERRNYLLSLISQSENNMASLLQTARNSPSIDPHIQQKINQLRSELTNRKEVYNKFVATFGAMVTQQMVNGIPPSNMPHMYVLLIVRCLIVVDVLVETTWRIPLRNSLSRHPYQTLRFSLVSLLRLTNLLRDSITFLPVMAHLRCLIRVKVL